MFYCIYGSLPMYHNNETMKTMIIVVDLLKFKRVSVRQKFRGLQQQKTIYQVMAQKKINPKPEMHSVFPRGHTWAIFCIKGTVGTIG
jgi:hypothetical protein